MNRRQPEIDAQLEMSDQRKKKHWMKKNENHSVQVFYFCKAIKAFSPDFIPGGLIERFVIEGKE